AAAAFLQAHGFHQVQTVAEMRLEPSTPLAATSWPEGYTLRPYGEVNDPAILAEAVNRGFTGHWENRERPVDEIARQAAITGHGGAGILLAFAADGAIAGVCWTSMDPEKNARRGEAVGHIDKLGVVPEHRRRGL